MKTLAFALTAGVALAGGVAVFAQRPRPAAVRPVPPAPVQKLPLDIKTAKDPGAKVNWKPESPDDPYLYLYGDAATYRDTAEGGIATLSGNAHLLYKQTRFESDKIVYNRKTQIGIAPTKLQIDDAQNTVVGDRGEADYGRKVAKLNGNITIHARPKPGAENAPEGSARREFKEPAVITCSEVIYNWKTKIADTSKDTTIRCWVRDHLWTITADAIQYRGKEEIAVLTGNVKGVNDREERFLYTKLTVVLTEGKEAFDSEQMEKGSRVFIENKDEDETKPPAKPDEKKEKKGNP